MLGHHLPFALSSIPFWRDRRPDARHPQPRRRSWVRELTYFLIAYLMYTAARWIFVGDLKTAQSHANWIVDLEKRAGIAIEGTVQERSTTALSPR
jgi:hypothetical protein